MAHEQEILYWLWALLKSRGTLTVDEAWSAGYLMGYYIGGEAPRTKEHLDKLCQLGQAKRNLGFCNAVTEAERAKAKRWATYWTPK